MGTDEVLSERLREVACNVVRAIEAVEDGRFSEAVSALLQAEDVLVELIEGAEG